MAIDARDFTMSEYQPPASASLKPSRASSKYEEKLMRLETRDTSLSNLTTKESLAHLDTRLTSFEAAHDGRLYDRDGNLVRQPAPTSDPRDPLNLSLTRKIMGVSALCLFGALAASAELILGAMLPVFALEYADVDPKLLKPLTETLGGLPAGTDPLSSFSTLFPEAPPIWKIYLLASLPVLMMGVANLALIPMAIAVGRRAVVLTCGVVAVGGALWAGCSQSLASHLAARCIQALGAGTVESLIPFMIQDIVFVHERNTWISGVFAAQGIIIIVLGIAAPHIIIYLSWRWVYFITSIAASFFLVGVFFFMPETRFERSRSEMDGIPREEYGAVFSPRTLKSDIAIFDGKADWRKGWNAFLDTLRTFFYPQILFITLLNSAMIACALGAGYTVAPALITQPWSWPFLNIGLCLIPLLIAAICVAAVTGKLADFVANTVARKSGMRTPENQLLNLVLPTICAIIGSVLFGFAGSEPTKYSWGMFLFGLGLMAFGFLGANTVGAVYVLECYPHLAGPALVNIASFRQIIAFVLSFYVSEWIASMGYLRTMLIYTGIISVFALMIPVVYIYGPAWRRKWPADRFGR